MVLNELIKTERKKQKISQEELANKLGIRQDKISKWESGKIKIPDDFFKYLALELNINESVIWNARKTDSDFNFKVSNIDKFILPKLDILKTDSLVISENLNKVFLEYDKMLKYVYLNIKKIVDVIFDNNLQAFYEDKDQCYRNICLFFDRLSIDSIEESRLEDIYIYNILISLIILTKETDKELNAFLIAIVNFYKNNLNNLYKNLTYIDFNFRQISQELGLFENRFNSTLLFNRLQYSNFSYIIRDISDSSYTENNLKYTKKILPEVIYIDFILFFISNKSRDLKIFKDYEYTYFKNSKNYKYGNHLKLKTNYLDEYFYSTFDLGNFYNYQFLYGFKDFHDGNYDCDINISKVFKSLEKSKTFKELGLTYNILKNYLRF